jgi:sugar phosphate isomerase/epimerase
MSPRCALAPRPGQHVARAHPDNGSERAWSDLRRSLDLLLDAATRAGIRLGVEPEPGNVVVDAPTAARLLDDLGADAPIGVVFDPADLLTPDTVDRQQLYCRDHGPSGRSPRSTRN